METDEALEKMDLDRSKVLDELAGMAQSAGGYDDLDTQILKLKASQDELREMLKLSEQTLSGLLEQKRNGLVAKIAAAEDELANIEDELGIDASRPPQKKKYGPYPRKPPGMRTGHGWNKGLVRPGSYTEKIVNLLKASPEKDFSTKELARAIGVEPGNVHGISAHQVANGIIRKFRTEQGLRWTWSGPKPQ